MNLTFFILRVYLFWCFDSKVKNTEKLQITFFNLGAGNFVLYFSIFKSSIYREVKGWLVTSHKTEFIRDIIVNYYEVLKSNFFRNTLYLIKLCDYC